MFSFGVALLWAKKSYSVQLWPSDISQGMEKLGLDFYRRPETLVVAEELLGKVLVTEVGGVRTSGMIVESVAYLGKEDKAAHSYGGRRTARTEVMFAEGGVAYVYLCYGMYNLFNVITNVEGEPHGVLIRGVEPLEGIPHMLERRGMAQLKHSLTAGPGALAKAMGITLAMTGLPLTGDTVWLEDRGVRVEPERIVRSPRVGVAYAQEDALLPYRFRIQGNPWSSKAK